MRCRKRRMVGFMRGLCIGFVKLCEVDLLIIALLKRVINRLSNMLREIKIVEVKLWVIKKRLNRIDYRL